VPRKLSCGLLVEKYKLYSPSIFIRLSPGRSKYFTGKCPLSTKSILDLIIPELLRMVGLLPDILSSFDADFFLELFPFHVLYDRRLTVVSVGSGLQAALQYADVIGSPVTDVFTLTRPLMEFSLNNVRLSLSLSEYNADVTEQHGCQSKNESSPCGVNRSNQ